MDKREAEPVSVYGWVEQYCDWLYKNEKSLTTIQKYRRNLRNLADYFDGRPITKEGLIVWKTDLKETVSPATVNSAISAANGFFHFMRWEELHLRLLKIGNDPFYPEEKELSKREYESLVVAAVAQGNNRLAMVLQTICAIGIRVSELKFVTVEAVRRGVLLVENKGRIRKVYLPDRLRDELTGYCARYGIEVGSIFITRSGNVLDRSNIWRDMKKLSETAQVKESKIFPHSLRHLFARTYYEREKDLARLADILGHGDVNTTRIYTMKSGKEHKKQLEQMGLVAGIFTT